MSKGMMKTNRMRARPSAIIVMLLILALPGLASAQSLGGLSAPVKALVTGLAAHVLGTGPFVLNFEPTPNLWAAPNGAQPAVWPDAAMGTMVLYLYNGQTVLQFTLTNARPNTIYTIWTVFYPLAWPIVLPAGSIRPQSGPCPSPSNILRVTTTWLRKYIAQVLPEGRASYCANYNASDPASIYWQCIDPSTVDSQSGNGLPRVWRFPFDHFRLAAHPDGLTHGFIGGNEGEHVIDMVGRRCQLTNNCP